MTRVTADQQGGTTGSNERVGDFVQDLIIKQTKIGNVCFPTFFRL